jgi:hypothetical protein
MMQQQTTANPVNVRPIYNMSDIEKENISAIEQGKTHFLLNLSAANFEAARDDLANISSLMIGLLEKYFTHDQIAAETYIFRDNDATKAENFYQIKDDVDFAMNIAVLRKYAEGLFHIYNKFAAQYLGVKIDIERINKKKG